MRSIYPKQLEKAIGKVKTKKYGGRIIELMRSHIADPGAGNGSDAKRKPKKDNAVIEHSVFVAVACAA